MYIGVHLNNWENFKIPLIDIISKINVNDKNIISIQDGEFEKELDEVSTKLKISLTKVKIF